MKLPVILLTFCATVSLLPSVAFPQSIPFDGARSSWHGFDRYDYVMDDQTMDIIPFQRSEDEGDGIKEPTSGQHRCVIVVPKQAAPGNPWSWQGCYWNHQPQTEIELLRRGFHIAYISANADLKPGKEWEAWYKFLTEKHGLNSRPAFIGMSRGGEYSYTWAVTHPDQVACIYADNTGGNEQVLLNVGVLARRDIPLLHVCGSIDPLLGRFSEAIEGIYHKLGGRITTMIKEGEGHHPHSLQNPKPLADWIEQNYNPREIKTPGYVPAKFTRTSYYGDENLYREFPDEHLYLTLRGPGFTGCYDRYLFQVEGVEGALTVIEPNKPAAGNPWIYRADFVERNANVDQALLERGYRIVTGPIPYNGDGPTLASWNRAYEYLVSKGFSAKPVLEGRGGAAGDAYAWAISNPDKVSCIYAENPLLKNRFTPAVQPLENLGVLAQADIPVFHSCGSLDPFYESNTREAKKLYEDLGGKFTVLVAEGRGHYPIAPDDPKPAVDFIIANTR